MAWAEGHGATVRIGEPASKHRVSDADVWHAVRTAIRKIDLDDDLTMPIGPAQDGTPLEIGILDLNGEDPGHHPRDAAAPQVLPAHQAEVIA